MRDWVLIAFLFAAPAQAADPWTKEQVALEVAYQVLWIADFNQTKQIAKAGRELNPYLGCCPSDKEVEEYFLRGALLHLATSHLLPSKWRTAYGYLSVGYQYSFVERNINLGWEIEF